MIGSFCDNRKKWERKHYNDCLRRHHGIQDQTDLNNDIVTYLDGGSKAWMNHRCKSCRGNGCQFRHKSLVWHSGGRIGPHKGWLAFPIECKERYEKKQVGGISSKMSMRVELEVLKLGWSWCANCEFKNCFCIDIKKNKPCYVKKMSCWWHTCYSSFYYPVIDAFQHHVEDSLV